MTTEADGTKKVVQASQLVVPLRGAPKIKPHARMPAPWDRTDRVATKELKSAAACLFFLAALMLLAQGASVPVL